MGFGTQAQRAELQQAAQAGYSQGGPDDFAVISDDDDLPF